MDKHLFMTYSASGAPLASEIRELVKDSLVFDLDRKSIYAQGREFGYVGLILNGPELQEGERKVFTDASKDAEGNIILDYTNANSSLVSKYSTIEDNAYVEAPNSRITYIYDIFSEGENIYYKVGYLSTRHSTNVGVAKNNGTYVINGVSLSEDGKLSYSYHNLSGNTGTANSSANTSLNNSNNMKVVTGISQSGDGKISYAYSEVSVNPSTLTYHKLKVGANLSDIDEEENYIYVAKRIEVSSPENSEAHTISYSTAYVPTYRGMQEFEKNLNKYNDALRYCGTVTPTSVENGTWSVNYVPPVEPEAGETVVADTKTGAVYKVDSTGYIGTQKVNAGDMIISYNDSAVAGNNTYWNIINENIDLRTISPTQKYFNNSTNATQRKRVLTGVYLTADGTLSYSYYPLSVSNTEVKQTSPNSLVTFSTVNYENRIDLLSNENNIGYPVITAVSLSQNGLDTKLSYAYTYIYTNKNHHSFRSNQGSELTLGTSGNNLITGISLSEDGVLTYQYSSVLTSDILWERGNGDFSLQTVGTGSYAYGAYSIAAGGGNIDLSSTVIDPSTNDEITGDDKNLLISHFSYVYSNNIINTIASGSYSHAEGWLSYAKGFSSHAEGSMTIAYGELSHAEGTANIAYGIGSHAEGGETFAYGEASHTEGYKTKSIGDTSHAEGLETISEGNYSHAEGEFTYAYGHASHTEGFGTVAYNTSEHAQGKYNISRTGTIEIAYLTISTVGIGTGEEDRRNAIEIMQNGDFYLYGVGEYDGTNIVESKSLQQYFEDKEFVISAALNDLNERLLNINASLNNLPENPWVLGTGDGSAVLKGSGSTASGTNSVAEGWYSKASGLYSHAEGQYTNSLNRSTHSEGSHTTASSIYSHAEGEYSYAMGTAAHVEGGRTYTTKDYSHAEGWYSYAYGTAAHSEGIRTVTYNEAEHASGKYNVSRGGNLTDDRLTIFTVGIGTDQNHRKNAFEIMQNGDFYLYGIGNYNGSTINANTLTLQTYLTNAGVWQRGVGDLSVQTTGTGAYSIGNYTTAQGYNTYAIGAYSDISGYSNVLPSNSTKTDSSINIRNAWYNSADINKYSLAYGIASSVEGKSNIAIGAYSHVEGSYSYSFGRSSHSEGEYSYAVGNFSHVEGTKNIVNSSAGHAEGSMNKITASARGHVEGYSNTVSADDAHAEGSTNIVSKANAHAEGYDNTVSGLGAHAEGYSNIVTGNQAHVEGLRNSAYATSSHAEGRDNVALKDTSHAEGEMTYAYGIRSHTEGFHTYAWGKNSHTEGYYTYSYDDATGSHVEGYYTEVRNTGEHASGRYNVSTRLGTTEIVGGETEEELAQIELAKKYNTLFSIGNGFYGDLDGFISEHRRNAFEVTDNGELYLLGLGDYDGTNTQSSYSLREVIIEDELVTSYALNDLNERISTTNYRIDSIPEQLWKYGTGVQSIEVTENGNNAVGNYSVAAGKDNSAIGNFSFVVGSNNTATGIYSVAAGNSSNANANGTIAIGVGINSSNQYETAFGRYNESVSFRYDMEPYNIDLKTIFSIGIGSGVNSRKNAISINDNGEIYIVGIGNYDGTFIKNNVFNYDAKSLQTYLEENERTISEALNDLNSRLISVNDVVMNLPSSIFELGSGNKSIQSPTLLSTANGNYSVSIGNNTITNNESETAFGKYNVSNTTNSTFGNAGNTIFSIGAGSGDSNRKNLLEVMQNGSIYLYGIGNYTGTTISGANTLNDVLSGINTRIDTIDSEVVKSISINGDQLNKQIPDISGNVNINITGFIGTTALQATSAVQDLTGIDKAYINKVIYSGATAVSHDYTHIPSDGEIAITTGNGDGGVSAWIWRENYSSSNWGIFHNNSTNYLHIVGSSTSRLAINLSTGNIGIGTDAPTQKLHVNGGLLAITNNGNTLTIGSQNSSFLHIYNSANVPFIFNRALTTQGNIYPYTTDTYNLGTSTNKWNNLFVNNIKIGTHTISPINTNDINIAGPDDLNYYNWKFNHINLDVTGQVKIATNSNTAPLTVTSSKRVDNLFAQYANEWLPIAEKTYENYTCGTGNNQYLFFINVTPTTSRWTDVYSIRYKLIVNTSVKECQGEYDCYVAFSGSQVIYANFNKFYSGSYYPIYTHYYLYYDTEAKFNNREAHPVKIGATLADAYHAIAGSSNGTSWEALPRDYTIKIYEANNCTVSFIDPIETYAGIYNANYYTYTGPNATSLGLQESGDSTDTTTMQLYYTHLTAGENGLKRYSLCMEDSTGKWQSFTTGTGGTGTSKAVNSAAKFKLHSKVYYLNMSSDIAANAITGNGVVRTYNGAIDYRNSLNLTNSTGLNLVANKPIFIIGTLDSDGYFRLPSTGNWWTQDVPTSEDGKLYIMVSPAAYSWYQSDFINTPNIYWYKNGAFRIYNPDVKSISINPNSTDALNATTLSGNTIDLTSLAGKSYVDTKIAALVNSAPAALDTLNELAAALGNDSNFATTINNSLAGKLSLSGGTMTGNLKFANTTALPADTAPAYFLCVSATTNGITKYTTKANALKALTGLTSTAVGSSTQPIYWDGTKFANSTPSIPGTSNGTATANTENQITFVESLSYEQLSGNYTTTRKTLSLPIAGDLKWGLYRNNVSGNGTLTKTGTYGSEPIAAGTYRVKIYMKSSTASFTLTSNFGSSYNISTTNGIIDDIRDITINSNTSWTGSVTSVATNTILSVNIYAIESNLTAVGKVAVTNNYNDLLNKPTIPTVNNGTLTIQKTTYFGEATPTITPIATFSANQSGNVTANIQINELPSSSTLNNGCVLQVVNGVPSWEMPVSVYSGSAAPNNNQGNNGDLYLQI